MSDDDRIDDPIPRIRAAVLARLRQLHADPSGEWRSTVGPLLMFAGAAVSKLAILTGERDGLADLMADGADPEVFDDAASALTALWQIVAQMTIDAEE
jgi:hypothetical protein